MRRARLEGFHPPGLLERVLELVRGREQSLLQASAYLPLLLLSYPRGARAAAQEVEFAATRVLPLLKPELRDHYHDVVAVLPAIVVVLLRPYNVCGCLGHYHPPGAESRLARRLAADLGSSVGEIDLAYDGIRAWRPQPLAALAVTTPQQEPEFDRIHFHAALLSVLLHELEHLAFPDRFEADVRKRSNAFHHAVMDQLVSDEFGASYGMTSSSRRP
jgi:hypothetical protein